MRTPLITCLILLLLSATTSIASIFMVTNTQDGAPGSLRAALDSANTQPGYDEIHFNFSGGGPYNLMITSSLGSLAITDPVLIDGFTQPGTFLTPSIVMYGRSFDLKSSDISIHGLRFEMINQVNQLQLSTDVYRNWSISDCEFYAGSMFELDMTRGAVSHIVLENNWMEGFGDFVMIDLHPQPGDSVRLDSIFIIDNEVRIGGSLAAVVIEARGDVDCRNVQIAHNQIGYLLGGGLGAAIAIEAVGVGTAHAQISDVTVRQNGFSAAAIGPGSQALRLVAGGPNCEAATIEHVTIDSNGISHYGVGIELQATGGCTQGGHIRDFKIADNAIQFNHVGIALSPPSGSGMTMVQDIDIVHNNISSDSLGMRLTLADPVGGSGPNANHSYNGIRLADNHIYDHLGGGVWILDEDGALPSLAAGVQGISLTRNLIHGNDDIALLIGQPDSVPACELPVPVISTFGQSGPFIVHGSLAGMPNTDYRLEYFASGTTGTSYFGEAETYLGSDTIALDAQGHGSLAWPALNLLPGKQLTVTATNLTTQNTGCYSRPMQAIVVAVPMPAESQHVVVFPNPVAGNTLHYTSDLAVHSAHLVDARGRSFHLVHDPTQHGMGEINLPQMPAGIYVLQLHTLNGTWSQRVVLLR